MPWYAWVLLVACCGLLRDGLAQNQAFSFRNRLDGPNAGDRLELFAGDDLIEAGSSVAPAGDVNGDGVADLVIGASGTLSDQPGRAFLFLGQGNRPSPLKRELAAASGVVVEIYTGRSDNDLFGQFVAPAGDVNGDGFDDVLIGAPTGLTGTPPGVVLVLGSDHLPSELDLSSDRTRNGVLLTSFLAGEGALGLVGSGVGDINDDGFDDIAIGIPDGLSASNNPANPRPGKIVVVFGQKNPRSVGNTVDVATLSATASLTLHGPVPGSSFGAAICAVGDIDGDQRDDYVVGAPNAGSGGSVFLFFGQSPPLITPDLTTPDGNTVVELTVSTDEWSGATFGASIAGGQNATGDAGADLLFGLPQASSDGTQFSGAAFLLPGDASLRDTPIRTLPDASTLVLRGRGVSNAGASVTMVPDVNNDGLAEIVVGAPARFDARGSAYLVYSDAGLSGEAFLPDLAPDQGVRFFVDTPGSRVGQAVAGLEDFDGDLRGEVVIGAPGLPIAKSAGSGSVFVAFARRGNEANSPRDLRAELLSGGRVHLVWTVSDNHRYLNVFRDDSPVPINPVPLPGRLMEYTDVDLPVGEHRYFVEANDDPTQRTDEVRVLVGLLPVADLRCSQVGTDLLIRWSLADRYQALEVRLDDNLVVTLPPLAREILIPNVPLGDHLVEVRDPSSPLTRTTCVVEILDTQLPAISDLTCVVQSPSDVQLTWTPDPIYVVYKISRRGLVIAELPAGTSTYVDQKAPAGDQRYVVTGITTDKLRTSSAVCEVTVGELRPPSFISGRVRFQDIERTPVGRGRVLLLNEDSQPVASAQVDGFGRFALPVSLGQVVQLRYLVDLQRIDDRASANDHARLPTGEFAITTPSFAIEGRSVTIDLPLPVVLLSARQRVANESISTADRWDPLVASARVRVAVDELIDFSSPALFYSFALPPSVARGALALSRNVELVHSHLAGQFGRSPKQLDLVAFGVSGLAARLHIASAAQNSIARAILLGTPNLGTTRAAIEARGERATRQFPELLEPTDSDDARRGEYDGFVAATQQTPEFLGAFNLQVAETRGAEFHLVAGTAGRSQLDAILGCSTHDDRVCVESAHGGIAGAQTHTINETHELLGRGRLSISLILDSILSVDGVASAPDFAGGAGNVAPILQNATGEGSEGGAGNDSSYALETFYSGFLEPGRTAEPLLQSDTSDSIIVILNARLPGGLNFSVQTPSGSTFTPSQAGGTPDVDYQTYGDGEGNQIQLFQFTPSEVGDYVAMIDNPVDNVPVPYTIELYGLTDVRLFVDLDPPSIEKIEGSLLLATLTKVGAPITDASLVAKIWRPNGLLEILSMRDDGLLEDAVAGDGVYSAAVDTDDQAGVHLIEVTATGSGGSFTNERTVQLEVQSAAALLQEASFSSGAAEGTTGSVFETLWIDGALDAQNAGVFVISGILTDAQDLFVAGTHTIIETFEAGSVPFQLQFSGEQIYTAQLSGPYTLSSVDVYDVGADYVIADGLENAHQTVAYTWDQFGTNSVVPFIRGDTNGDGRVDVSDSISTLLFLFAGASENVTCLDAANADDDFSIHVSDAIYVLNYLFDQGPPPPAPGEACGLASTSIGCESYTACQ